MITNGLTGYNAFIHSRNNLVSPTSVGPTSMAQLPDARPDCAHMLRAEERTVPVS